MSTLVHAFYPRRSTGAICRYCQAQRTMLLDTLHSRKAEVETLAKQFGVRRIRVFGSVARGEERPDSDIDFLVDLPRGYDLFAQRMPLTNRLKELFGRPVEVIPEHELNRHMRDTILKEAVDL